MEEKFNFDMIQTFLVTGVGSEGRSTSISKPNFTGGKNGFNSQSQFNQRGNNADNIAENIGGHNPHDKSASGSTSQSQ